MPRLESGTIVDPVKDLLVAEFGREAPRATTDPTLREGLYKHASGVYYRVRWKLPDDYLTMMNSAGTPREVETLDCRETTEEEARAWLESKIKWARLALGIETA